MFQTRITEMFGIRYPIVVGTMMHLSGAEMVAAASNAGALGVLASAMFPTKEDFRKEVVLSSKGVEISHEEFEKNYLEKHVRHSNALHSHSKVGTTYFVGPLARLNLNYVNLRPIAQEVVQKVNLKLPQRNPYMGLLARAVELVEVCDLAIELVEGYQPKGETRVNFKPRAGEGCGVSEAPRGLLYHRYIVDGKGWYDLPRSPHRPLKILPRWRLTCGR